MPYVILRHKVNDYEKFRAVFAGGAEGRRAGSSKGGVIYRSADDPNDLFILNEVEDLDKARAYAADPQTRALLEKAGVEEMPEIRFVGSEDRFEL